MTIRITTTRAAVALVLALAYVGLTPAHSRGRRSRASADHGGPADAAGADAAAAGADERPRRSAQGRQLAHRGSDLARAKGVCRRQGADGHHVGRPPHRPRESRRDERAARNDHAGARVAPPGDSRARSCAAGAVNTDAGAVPARRRERTPPPPDRRDDARRRIRGSAAAAVRQLVRRLHGRQLLARGPGVRELSEIVSRRARARTKRSSTSANRSAWEKKDMEAVVAYDRVIANYPGSASVPTAYYKRGWRSSGSEKPRARESRTKRSSNSFPTRSRRSLPSSGSNG